MTSAAQRTTVLLGRIERAAGALHAARAEVRRLEAELEEAEQLEAKLERELDRLRMRARRPPR